MTAKRPPAKGRYGSLDLLRGVNLVSMMAYHACWDIVWMFGVDWGWYKGPGAYLWQQGICWTFILLSGFCWPLGRRPVRRGAEVFGCGALVTAVTVLFMPGERILFGVLTLLGSCGLLLAPLDRFLRRIPAGAGLAGSLALFALLRNVNGGTLGFEGLVLAELPAGLYRNLATAYLGFPPADFFSTDYFSLLPWFFLFLAGYFLHFLVGERIPRRPERAFRALRWMGRWSLPLYLLHQPVIYGALTALFALWGR